MMRRACFLRVLVDHGGDFFGKNLQIEYRNPTERLVADKNPKAGFADELAARFLCLRLGGF
jgi:hypothetical protein